MIAQIIGQLYVTFRAARLRGFHWKVLGTAFFLMALRRFTALLTFVEGSSNLWDLLILPLSITLLLVYGMNYIMNKQEKENRKKRP